MFLTAFLLSLPLAAAPLSVDDIVEQANHMAYYQGNDGKATVTMTIVDKNNQTRERECIISRKDADDTDGDQMYFVYFRKPADVRKMAFMVHKHADTSKDDDRWLYLPNIDLVKRIAASDKRTRFVGSDFFYEDVSGRNLNDDTHTLLEENEEYYVIDNTPKRPSTVEFSHFVVSIDKNTFLPMSMKFYDKNGDLYRTIESQEVQLIDGKYHTVVKSLVKDLATGGSTSMVFSNVSYDVGIDDSLFTERYLKRPPRGATQ